MSSMRMQSALARRLPVKLTLRSKRLVTGAEAPGYEAVKERFPNSAFVIGRDSRGPAVGLLDAAQASPCESCPEQIGLLDIFGRSAIRTRPSWLVKVKVRSLLCAWAAMSTPRRTDGKDDRTAM